MAQGELNKSTPLGHNWIIKDFSHIRLESFLGIYKIIFTQFILTPNENAMEGKI